MALTKFKNRYNLFYIIVLILFGVLVFRLATLTIVEGEEYRAVADVKTIRDIPIKSPRGNIYDRNGELLAGNVPSFTVQIRKDEIESKDLTDTILLLAKILDRNNERLIDEFPISMDRILFEPGNEPEGFYYPEEYIEFLFREHQLVEEIFSTFRPKTSTINVHERILLILDEEFENLGIEYTNNNYRYIDEKVDREVEPIEFLSNEIYKDGRLINRLLSNSEIRSHIFGILKANELVEGIDLIPYSFTYDNEFRQIKTDLMNILGSITYESEAKDDFLNLARHYISGSFFRMAFESNDQLIMPGVFLFDEVVESYPDLPITYRVDEDANMVYFNFTNEVARDEMIATFGYSADISAYNVLIDLAQQRNLDFKIYEMDEIKFYAQERLLTHVNPMISVSSWEYTPVIRKENWIKENLGHNYDGDIEAETIFYKLKERFLLGETDDYLSRKYFIIRERYIKQGYLAFHPIDISYEVSQKTVGLLAENSDKLKGVEVVVQPLRYYPFGESAAHIIGYLGKISQEHEIQTYIQQAGYSQDDLIGKTGVEESFEQLLSGTKGKETLKVDVNGNRISTVETDEPVPGNNLHLTIDITLQQKSEKMMQDVLEQIRVGGIYESKWGDYEFDRTYKNAYSGALVAIDVQTGELITMVNYPSYDPNLFSTGISHEDWISLTNESRDSLAPRPLYNISMLTAIQPGSTFKVVTALAALEKGISPYERVYCAGHMEVGNHTFGCWIWNMYRSIHGYENMYEAIRDSCNFYFYSLTLGENRATNQKTSVRVDLEDILSMATQLGLNDKTGIEIEIPNEVTGGIPNPQTKLNSIRSFLRVYLNQNIENFYKEGHVFSEDDKAQMINEIVNWARLDAPLTRGEVYSNLLDLNLNPERLGPSGISFVDMVKYSFLNQAVWNEGDNLNISIGQGDNAYTPLQMANMTATIANGGYLRNVSTIKKGTTYDNRSVVYQPDRLSERISLTDYGYLDEITTAMVMVSDDSKVYNDFPVKVASKTGTAERDGVNPETGELYDEFSWYIAYAPAEAPEIAVTAVFFQGGSGRFPAPLVRDVIGEYLGLEPPNPIE